MPPGAGAGRLCLHAPLSLRSNSIWASTVLVARLASKPLQSLHHKDPHLYQSLTC